jgi:hypothetical protein
MVICAATSEFTGFTIFIVCLYKIHQCPLNVNIITEKIRNHNFIIETQIGYFTTKEL